MPGPSTTAVHGVRVPSRATDGALHPAVQRSSAFLYPELPDGGASPYIYTRYTNPTLEAVEAGLAELEGGGHALLWSSGMAAITATVLSALPPGGAVAVQRGVYGGTTALLRDELAPHGIKLHVLDATAPPAPGDLPDDTALLWMESITNPLLRVADVAAWADAAHAAGARLAVDATFATPTLQRPLDLGADIVMHSATKYLGGHSDLIAGLTVTRDQGLRDALWRRRRNLGGCLDPDAAWLLARGTKTLALRVRAQCANARAVANVAAQHPAVTAVHHPGHSDHPDHATARRLLSDFGGMVTLDLGSRDAATAFRRAVRLIAPAASLGGVESLASLPLETSHAYATAESRAADGITDGLVRISCGIEDEADLLADVAQALDAAGAYDGASPARALFLQ